MKRDDFDVKIFSNRFSTLLDKSSENTHSLAKKLDLSPATISRYANGVMTPKLITLYAIADIFNVNPLWLMGLDEKENATPKSLGDSLTILDGKIRKIPLFESVAAGFGCCANNQIIDYIPLMIDSDAEADETICIKVSGNSMYPKIEDGDIIAVHKQPSIDSGKIGVFLIDNEDGVVKKANYVYDEDWLELLSFNPEYMPRRFEGPDVERVKTLGLVKQIIKMI